MSSAESVFTFRDRIKVACIQKCIELGLDEETMIPHLQQATLRLRQNKQAGILDAGRKLSLNAIMLGGLTLPVAAVAAAYPAMVAGRTVKDIEVGRLPSVKELQMLDEIAALNRTREEVERRTSDYEEEKNRRSKPSAYRMF